MPLVVIYVINGYIKSGIISRNNLHSDRNHSDTNSCCIPCQKRESSFDTRNDHELEKVYHRKNILSLSELKARKILQIKQTIFFKLRQIIRSTAYIMTI